MCDREISTSDGAIAQCRCATMGHVPGGVLVRAHRAKNRPCFQGEWMEVLMSDITKVYLFQRQTWLLATQIVAEFESPGAHDSVEEGAKLEFGANRSSARAHLDFGALLLWRFLGILFAFETLEILRWRPSHCACDNCESNHTAYEPVHFDHFVRLIGPSLVELFLGRRYVFLFLLFSLLSITVQSAS